MPPTHYGSGVLEGNNKPLAGSQETREPVFLVVGKLRRPHGIHGEMVMEVVTDFPERLVPGMSVYIGDAHRLYRVRKKRSHAEGMLISFDTIFDPESAGELRNEHIFVRADDRPALPEGEYYHHQLIGLSVFREDGRFLGKVIGFLPAGAACSVCEVRFETGGEMLFPWTDEIVQEVNLSKGQIHIHLIPGLLPEDSSIER